MPIDPAPPRASAAAVFDPRSVPVTGIDDHLPAVAAQRLVPQALRQRFAHPPNWTPELITERDAPVAAPALAAVLLPIVLRAQPTVLLTQRAPHLSSHAGQIAFPGGRCDPGDADAAATALREAQEEIGLPAACAEVLGQLPTYTTGTRFVITPVVALVQPPFALQLNTDEVADAFEVPLDFLMNPAHHRHHIWHHQGVQRQWLSMPYPAADRPERFIWGATAALLRNFYRFLSS